MISLDPSTAMSFFFDPNTIPKNLTVGDQFEYVNSGPLSFTSHHIQAEEYGRTIVRVRTRDVMSRTLAITNELHYAMLIREVKFMPDHFRTYGEHIVLPHNAPIRFEVIAK